MNIVNIKKRLIDFDYQIHLKFNDREYSELLTSYNEYKGLKE